MSTGLGEPPHCGGISLCQSKAQAAEALAAAGVAAPCFSVSLGKRWRHGREPGAPGGAALKVGGLVLCAAALGGEGKAALGADVWQVQAVLPPGVFSSALYRVVTYQFCLPERLRTTGTRSARIYPTRSIQITLRGWQTGFKMLQAARNRLSCQRVSACSTLQAQTYLQSQTSLCHLPLQRDSSCPLGRSCLCSPLCSIPRAAPGARQLQEVPSAGNHSLTLAPASRAE